MLIKVCGMRDASNIREVERLGIDLMGFIFYDKSPRYVSEVPSFLPSSCGRVGVFVNSPVSDVLSRVDLFGLDFVQLHGGESLEYLGTLRKALPGGVRIIRTVQVSSPEDAAGATLWDGAADLLLFETASGQFGGTGRGFDWAMLHSYQGSTPFLLAGGIGPESASGLKTFRHPCFLGVDLNSRFEKEPAIKDVTVLERFIDELITQKNNEQDK
ncbi:MAG: phosphoribosylanthranilate isomerase [Candidatus Cryptobacteroides sp.]